MKPDLPSRPGIPRPAPTRWARRLSAATVALGALATLVLAAPSIVAANGEEQNTPDSMSRPAYAIDVTNHPGKALFAEHCAMCHEGGMPKAPHREFLETMAPGAILQALNEGIMRQQAADIPQSQRRQIVEFLTKTDLATYKPDPGPVMCVGKARAFDLDRPPAAVGWGYDTRRFVPADVARLAPADVPRLKLKWAYAFPNALRARSQPVAALGALYVGSQDGTIYAFDLASGCAKWTSKVSSEVRTAIVVEPFAKGERLEHAPRLFFGDLLGRVYAMDALTGKLLWRTRPDDHANATITGSPAWAGDALIVPVSSLEVVTAADPNYTCCTFRGSIVALDPATGATRWTHYTVPQPATEQGKTAAGGAIMGPSGAPVWGSPAIDLKRGLVYHGSGENYSSPADTNSDALFAVDLKTGKRRWSVQFTAHDSWNGSCTLKGSPNCPKERGPDFDLAASPMLVDVGAGRQLVIAGQKSGMVYGVDPDSGKIVWSRRAGRGGIQGGIHFGMAAHDGVIYVGIDDLPMQSDGSESKDYGSPGLQALDAATGKPLWITVIPNQCGGKPSCDPGISAAVTAMPGVVFAGYLDGVLRAYNSETGKLLWQTDTTVPQRAVNGVNTRGGSISGPGVAIIDGNVVTNSGYGFSYHMPGNGLMVFSVDGR
jgi:polyvinyl alcohol dehydrogenase (cytochrome)